MGGLRVSPPSLAGCASLPPPEGRVPSAALEDTSRTQLGLAVAPAVAAHPGKTGIHPLFDPRDAFAARALLAAAAEKSIDAQYYIWHGDTVGNLRLRGPAAGGRPGRAGAPAARRHEHRRPRPGDRGARRASGHRGAPLQPVRAPGRARARFPVGLLAREPAHAQQVVHGGQPGERRRRAQHRQRVLRRGRGNGVRRPRRGRRRRGGARRLEAVRSLLEQRVRRIRPRASWPPPRRPISTRGSPRRAPILPPSPTSRPCAPRRSCATCSPGGCRWSGRTLASCTTTRPRRSIRRLAPTSCSSRRWWTRSAGRRSRSTSSRPTSCPATKAPRPSRRSPGGA